MALVDTEIVPAQETGVADGFGRCLWDDRNDPFLSDKLSAGDDYIVQSIGLVHLASTLRAFGAFADRSASK